MNLLHTCCLQCQMTGWVAPPAAPARYSEECSDGSTKASGIVAGSLAPNWTVLQIRSYAAELKLPCLT